MRTLEEMLKSKDKYGRAFAEVVMAQDGSHAIPHPAFFCGGKYHGRYMTHEELKAVGNGEYSPRWSAMKYHNPILINLNLEDQPEVDGYLGPMWDGGYLRYDTQEVYDCLTR